MFSLNYLKTKKFPLQLILIFPLLYDRQLKGTTWHFPQSAEYLLTKSMNSLDIHSVFQVTKAKVWPVVPPVYNISLIVCSLQQQFPTTLLISTPVLWVGLRVPAATHFQSQCSMFYTFFVRAAGLCWVSIFVLIIYYYKTNDP